MTVLIFKYAITSLIIVVVSEVARNFEKLGAFLGALPIVTTLIMIWLYVETKDTQKTRKHKVAYVLFFRDVDVTTQRNGAEQHEN